MNRVIKTLTQFRRERPPAAVRTGRSSTRPRFGTGFRSLLSLGLAPLGSTAARYHRQLANTGRLEHGLIIILPGIEGCSSINDSIARGLVEGQLRHAIRIIDWRSFWIWTPLHLIRERHNRCRSRAVAEIVMDYQHHFPGRPVHLIGHSAGAGIALFVLEALTPEHRVVTAVLMAAAVSTTFDVLRLLNRTERGIWNLYSPLDLPTTGLGTIIFGTMDRRHAISAGSLGFRLVSRNTGSATQLSGADAQLRTEPQLHQVRFRPSMMKSWNFGGHFGTTNAAFVQDHVAPICHGF